MNKTAEATTTHIAREHPAVEQIPKMRSRELWAYVLGELDFLATPEQKRVPVALSAAMHELSRRGRR
jgi:hypothetical protein